MKIFDDDVKKIKQENQIKSASEKEYEEKEMRHKALICNHILECLKEFPKAAEEVKLKTEHISVKTYFLLKSLDYWEKIEAWRLDTSLYITTFGCYKSGFRGAGYVLVSYEEMAEELYKILRSKLHHNEAKDNDIVKKAFVNLLSGRYLRS